MKIRHEDGAAHFSQLKQFARSAAHYKAACLSPRSTTRAMDVGTIAHSILLGNRPGRRVVVWDGAQRRGKEYDAFAAEHEGAEIVLRSAWNAGNAVAEAVRAEPLAAELLEMSRHEVPIRWEDSGIACATDGVDMLGAEFVAELKTTTNTEPMKWQRQALGMLYHAQLAFYADGARANGHRVRRALIVGAEVTPPYAVTVLELTPAMLEHGRRSVTLWLEQLRSAEENDFWPAYSQSVVAFDLPPWMVDADPGDDEESEDAA